MVKQYEVIMIDLDPVKGREKGKYRPCVVVSHSSYHNAVKKAWAVPVTSRENRYPTDVDIDTHEGKVHGIVDCAEIRSLDITARDYRIKDKLEPACVIEIKERIKYILNI